MRPALPALAALILAAPILAGCGSPGPDAPAAPPRPEPTAAEKAVLLAALPAPYNQGNLDNGAAVFARCRSCHTITEGGPNMTGPNLYGVFGRQAGTHGEFRYSSAVKTAGFTWDADHLDHWLAGPQTFLKGTKMSFAGLSDATDRRDVIAFLKVETGYVPDSLTASPSPAGGGSSARSGDGVGTARQIRHDS